jgi:hypothetical protein
MNDALSGQAPKTVISGRMPRETSIDARSILQQLILFGQRPKLIQLLRHQVPNDSSSNVALGHRPKTHHLVGQGPCLNYDSRPISAGKGTPNALH